MQMIVLEEGIMTIGVVEEAGVAGVNGRIDVVEEEGVVGANGHKIGSRRGAILIGGIEITHALTEITRGIKDEIVMKR